jgi:hypothetical protein
MNLVFILPFGTGRFREVALDFWDRRIPTRRFVDKHGIFASIVDLFALAGQQARFLPANWATGFRDFDLPSGRVPAGRGQA